jgi:hypothetical protein
VIRVQLTGGLGNQLFIWAAAHSLQNEFSARVRLVVVHDSNTRKDRPIEIQQISKICSHGITVSSSRLFGLFLRIIDKFHLERFQLSGRALKSIGIYSFNDPVSTPVFEYAKPRFIRCYFQRTDIVESSWEILSDEFVTALRSVDLSTLGMLNPSNSIHIRRGDFLALSTTHGVLTDEYFKENLNTSFPIYLCTDDFHPEELLRRKLKGKAFFTPNQADTWQTLKIFCDSNHFIGSNSTLSWWAAFLRVKAKKELTCLPLPWTCTDLGYENALRILGVDYKKSEFLNAG